MFKTSFFCTVIFLIFLGGFQNIYSQNTSKDAVFDNITLKIDTAFFSSERFMFSYQNEKYLFFKSDNSHDFAEISITPNASYEIQSIQLVGGSDFSIVDSIRKYDDHFFRGKIKFHALENNKHPSLIFSINLSSGKHLNYQIKLFPYFETSVVFENEPIDLFVDEEKSIEMPAVNVYNFKYAIDPNEFPEDEIKLNPSINSLSVKVKPKNIGQRTLTLKLKTIKPFVNTQTNTLSFDLEPIKIKINVKPNRIDYINPDRNTIYYNSDFKSTQEIQFDFNKNMILRKTYRIEDQPDNGGNLIAEIYTQSQVGNSNKIITRIRTFSLHRIHEGYLYIKDGDKTRFLTNFDIIEKPRIDEVSLIHEGSDDWSNNLAVNPGEKLEIRVKGTGMLSSKFIFDGAENVRLDTTRMSDEVTFYSMLIPQNISKRKINIFMNQVATQYSMQVKEYQIPREFDFVKVNYGERDIVASSPYFDKPIFYNENIRDINISFDPAKIDEGKLYGKQFVNIEVKVFNSKNDLLEIQNINNVAVCPGSSSPRGSFYDLKECRNQSINLNDYLFHKTYSFDHFTQIFITITHNEAKYGGPGFTRKIKLVINRKSKFDIDVSFPAGLLFYKFNDEAAAAAAGPAFRNLWGISIAFIAQFSFYEPGKINKFKPYNIGAGFIAINALDFSQNAQRDLGAVIIGTLVPLQAKKLSFPLYLGGGYLLVEKKWFVVFGPGLRVSF